MVSYEMLLSQLRSGDLSKLEKSLIENIREKESKSKGFGGKLPIIKRIVKNGTCANGNERFAHYHKFTYKGMERLQDKVIGVLLDAYDYDDAKSLEEFMKQNEYRQDELELATQQYNHCKYCYNRLMDYKYSDTSSINMTSKKMQDLTDSLLHSYCGGVR